MRHTIPSEMHLYQKLPLVSEIIYITKSSCFRVVFKLKFNFIFVIAAVFSSTSIAKNIKNFSHRYLETNEIEDDACLHTMERMYNDKVVASTDPDLSGEWTSAR